MRSAHIYQLIFSLALLACTCTVHAQAPDSTRSETQEKSAKKEKPIRNPKKASLYSAVLPGAGQIYNRKYWKLPIVYGAMATAVYLYFDNRRYYVDYRDAYLNELNQDDPDYVPSNYAIQGVSTSQLRAASDQSRQNMEYSVIGFLAIYGLQIIDATVDAHLSSFDVGDDLSMEWQPTLQRGANQQIMSGLTLNFRF
ncbi:MAG: hypothetical protein HQ500_06240 [Flavobacteriales bacterium]|nr:hypothetical protein [Flavobacteriales bacterium]